MNKSDLRIIFMGTPEFAVPSLEILIENGYAIVAVITSTDKYGGRGGKKLLESPIKRCAVKNDIPVLQPRNLKNPEFLNELRSFKANLQVVVAFRMLPVVVWDMPELGTINLHGSLLPKYRGAAPINWAIINGENETGVTTFKLKHEIDTGNIIFQEKLPIGETDTAGSIHDKMMLLGAKVVLKTVDAICKNKYPQLPQDGTKVSKAPKIYHEDCEISFDEKVKKVYNFIRGLSPYPAAWVKLMDKEVKVYMVKYMIEEHNILPGKIATDNKNYIRIYCRDGYVSLLEIKMAGKRKMDIKSFLNGTTITLK